MTRLKYVAPLILQEDFQPMTYGFKMAGDITDARSAGMMKEVEDELNRNIRVWLLLNTLLTHKMPSCNMNLDIVQSCIGSQMVISIVLL